MNPSPARGSPASARHDVSLLTDQDLYLFNEGTHYRLSEKLGSHPMEVEGVPGTYFAVWAPDAERVGVIGEFNGWNRASHPLRPKGRSGIWEGFLPGVARGALYKNTSCGPGSEVLKPRSPIPSRSGMKCRRGPPPSSGVWSTPGATAPGWSGARNGTRSTPRSRSTRSTSAPGAGSPRRTTGRSLIARSRRRWPTTSATRASRTSNFSPSWSIPSTARGDTRRPATSRRRPDTGRRRTSCFSSTISTRRASASSSTGCRRTFRPTPTDRPSSTARISTSTRTRGAASIPTGRASSSTTAGTRSGASSSAARCSGWSGTTRTACAWTPWRRCSTSTTRVRKVSGCRTPAAVARISRPSASCGSSTRPSTATAPASRPWPRNPPPGPWCRGRPIWAGSGSASSGTRDGCTTRSTISRAIRSTGSTTTTSSPSGCSTPGTRISSCRFRMTRSCTGRARSSPGCPATTGRSSPTSGRSSATCTASPRRSSFSWAASSASATSGTTTAASTGISSATLRTPGSGGGSRTSTARTAPIPRFMRSISSPPGFEWVDCNDSDQSVLSFLRRSRGSRELVLVACNFTSVPRQGYRVGVPERGLWREILNSDAREYGGSGVGNSGGCEAEAVPAHGRPYSLPLTLPPLAVVFLVREAGRR